MSRLEDYALVADTRSAALIHRSGAINWLCFPRFDSDACFSSLLGSEENGYWKIAPDARVVRTDRRYRSGTAVLETDLCSEQGAIRITDCMPLGSERGRIVRSVEGLSGEVSVTSNIKAAFGYGANQPWYEDRGECATAISGPNALALHAQVSSTIRDGCISANFRLRAGEHVSFDLVWYPSHLEPPPGIDVSTTIRECTDEWRKWSAQCSFTGPHRELVLRSLITLKALTYSPTGAVVAAPTTSLPEKIGGARNWDYRYCWLRDATLTLTALLESGYHEEASAFRGWLLRAIAGDPEDLQIMYGICGERRLTEIELPWLAGYEGARPVRIGNKAAEQFQLGVFGEVMDCLHQARQNGITSQGHSWEIERALLRRVEDEWQERDAGIWETRSGRSHFTHSKVMAWVAVDRALRSAEQYNLPAPLKDWQALRTRIHDDVCRHGYDAKHGTFTREYGGKTLDASLLMIPLVGFLPPHDPRVAGTVRAIEQTLMHDGFVHRYDTRLAKDGLPPGEGAFLACSFWLASNYLLLGRRPEAEELFGRLIALANDVGLLAEQYDSTAKRLLGNFPQAFSHLALVDTALDLYARGSASPRRPS